MDGMLIFLTSIFLLGLAVGSFLNVVIYRTLTGESPFVGRSRCPKCKRTIQARDNIPLLSFVFLRGRCRFCKAKIPWSYPVVEFLTGVLFVWWYLGGFFVFRFFQLTHSPFSTAQPLFWLVVGVLFLMLFFSDLLYGVLPDFMVGVLAVSALVYRLVLTLGGVMQPVDFWRSIGSALGVFGFFLGLILLTRGKGMGVGDAKLGLALGLVLGWPRVLFGLFYSFIFGAVVSVILLVTGKRHFGETVPFGPFMVLGAVTALLWQNPPWMSVFFSLTR